MTGPTTPPKILKTLDISRLHDSPPTRWLASPWIGRDALTLLVGEGGASKSWLSLDLAIRLASGIEFSRLTDRPTLIASPQDALPQPATASVASNVTPERPRYRVLYIDEDGQEPETKRRLSLLIHGHGIDQRSLIDFLYVSPPSGILIDSESDFRLCVQTCLTYSIDLIIIDSLISVHSQEESSNDRMRHVMRACLRRLMRSTGAGLLLLHHLTKPPSGELFPSTPLHRIRGATEIVNSSDAALYLSEGSLSVQRSRFLASQSWPKPLSVQVKDLPGPAVQVILR